MRLLMLVFHFLKDCQMLSDRGDSAFSTASPQLETQPASLVLLWCWVCSKLRQCPKFGHFPRTAKISANCGKSFQYSNLGDTARLANRLHRGRRTVCNPETGIRQKQ